MRRQGERPEHEGDDDGNDFGPRAAVRRDRGPECLRGGRAPGQGLGSHDPGRSRGATTTFKEVVGVVEGAQEPVFYTEEDLKQEAAV